MLEAAPPPPPATAILAQRRRAGADLDDDANVLQHLARACFRLARIVETSIRLGALATPLVLSVRGPASCKSRRSFDVSRRWRHPPTSRHRAASNEQTPHAGPPPPLRRGPLVALLPLGDARGGADGRQARAVGLVARGPLPARVLRPLRPFARPGAGARVARHGARPRGVARARLARRARRRRGARRHGLRRPGALGGTRRRLVFWGRGDGARAGPNAGPQERRNERRPPGRPRRRQGRAPGGAAARRLGPRLPAGLRARGRGAHPARQVVQPRGGGGRVRGDARRADGHARGARPASGDTFAGCCGGSHASKTSRETTKHRDTRSTQRRRPTTSSACEKTSGTRAA